MIKKYAHPTNAEYIIIALVAVLFTVFCIINSSPLIFAQESIENMKEYENSIFGVKIEYPSTWKIEEFEKKIKNDNEVGINKIVIFCPNSTLKQIPSDQIKTMVSNSNNTFLCYNSDKRFAVSVHNLPDEMDLAQYTNSKISSYKLELTDFKIIESNPNVMVDELPAYKVIYTYSDNTGKEKDKTIKVMEIWTVIDDDNGKSELKDHLHKAYALKYETIPIEFSIYLNTANNTVNSFELQSIDKDDDD
ncbi:MAG: hypothetical protein MRJ93_07215 [Nitrososphaeraceae archaeon]|nr:hypothetical protein [Nitrososphaeraceae archaeon]